MGLSQQKALNMYFHDLMSIQPAPKATAARQNGCNAVHTRETPEVGGNSRTDMAALAATVTGMRHMINSLKAQKGEGWATSYRLYIYIFPKEIYIYI
jgi:hypothetical protein